MTKGKEITAKKFFALDIKANLDKKGMNQKELSELIGITKEHMSKVMNGKANLSFDTVEKIANILEFNPRFYTLNN